MPAEEDSDDDQNLGEGRLHAMAAEQAALAMRQSLADAVFHAKRAADLRPIIRKRPLTSLSVAAGVGLAGALIAVPSERKRAASRMRALERAILAERAAGDRPLKAKATGGFVRQRVVPLALRYARPALISFLTSAATGAASGAAAAEATDEAPPADAGLDDVT